MSSEWHPTAREALYYSQEWFSPQMEDDSPWRWDPNEPREDTWQNYENPPWVPDESTYFMTDDEWRTLVDIRKLMNELPCTWWFAREMYDMFCFSPVDPWACYLEDPPHELDDYEDMSKYKLKDEPEHESEHEGEHEDEEDEEEWLIEF